MAWFLEGILWACPAIWLATTTMTFELRNTETLMSTCSQSDTQSETTTRPLLVGLKIEGVPVEKDGNKHPTPSTQLYPISPSIRLDYFGKCGDCTGKTQGWRFPSQLAHNFTSDCIRCISFFLGSPFRFVFCCNWHFNWFKLTLNDTH